MALILCSQCQQPISKDSSTCPLCGHPNEQQTQPKIEGPERKVSWPLLLGIIFIPYIFVWFVLRKGYKLTTQAISLAWLAFMLYCLAIEFYDPKHHPLHYEKQLIEIQNE
ncbi:zinc ribbon domain-containing protein [uncultured Shewanella sp.]|uniref:zinc ribbon domain-containing protein n=1 Tax=uncultured Shewanella sp. TaxID=173975 RepID=UPI002631F032|nr:zinc ribbon domain-containing protein [uncultured Shewanella sp.]